MRHCFFFNTLFILILIMKGGLVMAVEPTLEVAEYGVGNWPEEGRGNHRAVIRVEKDADIVWAHIPWRRRDPNPQEKQIRLWDTAANQWISEVFPVEVNAEYGDILFEPISPAPSEYHIYYMPVQKPERFVTSEYLPAQSPERTKLGKKLMYLNLTPEKLEQYPKAQLLRIEARSEFQSFYPMEVVATEAERAALLGEYPDASYLLFPEDRAPEHHIRMKYHIPWRWAERGPSNRFEGEAKPNEYYVFQIGVYATKDNIDDLDVRFGDLKNADGDIIDASALDSINLSGKDWNGEPITKTYAVPKGTVRALWVGVMVPPNAQGQYKGTLRIGPKTDANVPLIKAQDFELALNVAGEPIEDHGDNDIERFARLRWLNSTIGLEPTVVPPYTPVQRDGDKVSILDREIVFGKDGLPASIRSRGHEILAAPISLTVDTKTERLNWNPSDTKVVTENEAQVSRATQSDLGALTARLETDTEFDGAITVRAYFTAREKTELSDISLRIPMRSEVAKYMMGFARRGGYAPDEWAWKWDIDKVQQTLWIGETYAGLHLKLLHREDNFPFPDMYDVGLPESWGNGHKGGAVIAREGDRMQVDVFSGNRTLEAGETVLYRFRLLVTPFHEFPKEHWELWYGHHTIGGNVAHLHHGTGVNMWINYPFLEADKILNYRKKIEEQGYTQGLDLYYTVRELSDHAAELWALRSLGKEIFKTDSAFSYTDKGAVIAEAGGGYSWLQEHLVQDYSPGWMVIFGGGPVDAAIGTVGLSRWHNFYLKGLEYLMKKTGFKGLYLDGIAYDRNIMQRAARVMHSVTPDARVKFHSGNNYDYAGRKSSPLVFYAEHLPYFTQMWIGEMYDYNRAPDYWLVEISGVPFGVPSEMLNYHDGGNPYRGMLYGMYGRMHGSAADIWKLWDAFQIADAEMIGYWDKDCPVQTGQEGILATVYKKDGESLIAIGSWATETHEVQLEIDWDALGLDKSKVELYAPKIEHFQAEQTLAPEDVFSIDPAKGAIFWIKLKK